MTVKEVRVFLPWFLKDITNLRNKFFPYKNSMQDKMVRKV